MGCEVKILKYGKLQRLASCGGKKILRWIDECPNDLFSARLFKVEMLGEMHSQMTLEKILISLIS